MNAVVAPSHISRDAEGVAWIDATNVKVIEVVLDHLAYGWSAEAMHEQHPHLQMAQIHAALAFYYDHAAEFDAEIESQAGRIRETRSATGLAPLQSRLRLSRDAE